MFVRFTFNLKVGRWMVPG